MNEWYESVVLMFANLVKLLLFYRNIPQSY